MSSIERTGVIEKSGVVVHTATVNVKIMRLSKKQVTLSVFRQLDEEPIFTIDGNLRGVPWGRVNYLWGSDHKRGVEYHVVWQLEGKIKRAEIPDGRKITAAWHYFCFGKISDFWKEEYGDNEKVWDDEVKSYCKNFWSSVHKMRELDQLFIAV